jgi:hypothetical protein
VLEAAYACKPDRFVRTPPIPPELPTAACINKPDTKGGRSLNPTAKRLTGLDRFRGVEERAISRLLARS